MKKIRIFLLALLFSFIWPLAAQEDCDKPIAGKYKGHRVSVTYIRGKPGKDIVENLTYEGVELAEKINGLNSQIKTLNERISQLTGQDSKPRNQSSKSQDSKADSLQRQIWALNARLLDCEDLSDSLKDQVQLLNNTVRLLNDSVQLLKDSLGRVNERLLAFTQNKQKRTDKTPVPVVDGNGPYIGAYYSLGFPWLMNALLSGKNGETPIWSRQMTLSHQFGLSWGSRSLLRNGSLSLGAGLEYSRIRFAAGMGQNSYTLNSVFDNDNDLYTAHLTYWNVVERATLHYLSIPLTLSFGQPHSDRVSGYAQFTLAPSFCLASSFSAEGYYDLEGYYSAWDLTLSDFQPLGFGYNKRIETEDKKAEVNRFLLTGRLAGGVYLPLCRTSQSKTSPWVMKLGVKLDFSIIPKAKHDNLPAQDVFNATDYITQNNFLSSDGCRFLNPGMEVGIMYVLGTKNR